MRGVLNTNTGTVHRQTIVDGERAETNLYSAECGSLTFLPEGRLELTSVEGVVRNDGVSRCGRCFEGAGGY